MPVDGRVASLSGRARTLGVLVLAVVAGACTLGRDAPPDWVRRVAAGESLDSLQGTRWRWIGGGVDATPATVARPERYTVEFQAANRLQVRADCNRGFGAWRGDKGTLTIGPVSYSTAPCVADSRGAEFAEALLQARKWYLREGSLFLELPYDKGVLRMAPLAAADRP